MKEENDSTDQTPGQSDDSRELDDTTSSELDQETEESEDSSSSSTSNDSFSKSSPGLSDPNDDNDDSEESESVNTRESSPSSGNEGETTVGDESRSEAPPQKETDYESSSEAEPSEKDDTQISDDLDDTADENDSSTDTTDEETTSQATEQTASAEPSDEADQEFTKEQSGDSDSDQDIYSELDEYRGFSIFQDLGPESIKIIVENSTSKKLSSEEKLFEEGEESETAFYLILAGEIGISKDMRTETTHVNTLERGDYLGEFGMFSGKKRMAGAEAREASEVLEIPKEALDKLREADSEALIKVYENMFSYLGDRFKALANKAEKAQFWL